MNFESLRKIDVNPDDNNDGQINKNEKQNIKLELANLENLEEEIQKLNKKLQNNNLNDENGKNLSDILLRKKMELKELYDLLWEEQKEKRFLILKIQSEFTDLKNDINNSRKISLSINYSDIKDNWTQEEKQNPDYWKYVIEKINDYNKFKEILLKNNPSFILDNIKMIVDKFKLEKTEITEILKIAAGTEYWDEAFYKIKEMSKVGLNTAQITEILKITAGSKYWDKAFYNIEDMKKYGKLDSEQIEEVLKIASGTKYWYRAFYKINQMKEDGKLNSVEITEILKTVAGSKKWDEAFYKIKVMKEYGDLNPAQITEILKTAAGSKNWDEAFYKIKEMKEDGKLNNKQISEVLNNVFWKWNNIITEKFVKNYKNIKLERWSIFLWEWFDKYKKYFENDYKLFVEKILKKESKDVSYAINAVYDYYEENWNNHEQIEKRIKENLKKVSTEELFLSMWNHSINYATTFNLILEELDERLKLQNYFDYIDKDDNLNKKSKIFLKWSILAWLLARWKNEKALNLIINEKLSFDIIKQIINYKNWNIFWKEIYLWLMVWLKNILEKNKDLLKFILTNPKIKNNENFQKALKISLLLEWKEIRKEGIVDLTNEEKNNNDEYDKIRKKFLLKNNEIFKQKIKNLIYVYTEVWWNWFYERELEIYKTIYGYKEKDKWKWYVILEKNGVRVTFIKNDKIDDLQWILEEKKINPVMIAFRWHNYETSEIIKDNNKLFKKYKNTIIVDGWCRNNSVITSYREEWIKNQIVAYTSTWKWWATSQFTGRFISKYLRYPEKYENKDITLKELSEEILPKDSYSKTFMKFPWDLMDIILKIEDGEL